MLEMRRKHEAILAEQGLSVFCEVTNVHNLDSGILTAAQAHGFAGLDANTIIFGIHDESTATLSRLLRFTRQLGDLEKCTIIYRHALRPSGPRDIIVWWKGKESNGDLMLLQPTCSRWLAAGKAHRSSLRVSSIVPEPLRSARVSARKCSPIPESERKVEVVERPAEQSFVDVLKAHSKDAGLVFLGLPDVPDGDEETFAEVFAPLIQNMPRPLSCVTPVHFADTSFNKMAKSTKKRGSKRSKNITHRFITNVGQLYAPRCWLQRIKSHDRIYLFQIATVNGFHPTR